MGRFILGTFLAALAMFTWGFVFYGISPVMSAVVQNVDDNAATQAMMREHFRESGTYFLPSPSLPPEQMGALHQAGPLALITIRQEGAPAMDPMLMGAGFAHQWVTCLLLALLLTKVTSSLGGYWGRVGFVALAGFTAAFFIDYGTTIWWYGDRSFALANLTHNTVAWIVAGLVLAWLPGAPRATPSV
ncbi:MAG: hypothetical protein WBO47_06105 [Gammaproteobacteria bacterium]